MTDPVVTLYEPQHFTFGGVHYPLAAQSSGASLLSTCDPSLYHLLAFTKYVLETYIGAALTGAAATAAAPITATVAQAIAVDPSLITTAAALKFPLLAAWRGDETAKWRTENWFHRETRVQLAYILPTLTAAQMIKLAPILAGVSAVIADRIAHGSDPGYSSGASLFSLTTFEAMGLTSGQYGAFQWEGSDGGAGDLVFPAWTGTILLTERVMPDTTDLGTFAGADMAIADQPPTDAAVDVSLSTDVG